MRLFPITTQATIICYDILDLGKQLLPIGMLVVLDSIFFDDAPVNNKWLNGNSERITNRKG